MVYDLFHNDWKLASKYHHLSFSRLPGQVVRSDMRNFHHVFVGLLFIGCVAAPIPQPIPPPVDTDQCAAADRTLHNLDCHDPEGHQMWINLDGETFTVTCQREQLTGRLALDPTCIAASKSCAEANQCPIQ